MILYSRFNTYRKPAFHLHTHIVKEGGELWVEKRAASEESVDFCESLVLSYQDLENYTDINCVKAFKVGHGVVRFPYIENGVSVQTLCDDALAEGASFDVVLQGIKDFLSGFPVANEEQCIAFEEKFSMKKSGDMMWPSCIDVNLDNIIVEADGTWTLIDYEWMLQCAVPRKYVLFRALYYWYVSTGKDVFPSPLRTILEVQGFTSDDIEQCILLEFDLQSKVSKGVSSQEDFIQRAYERLAGKFPDESLQSRIVPKDLENYKKEKASFEAEEFQRKKELEDLKSFLHKAHLEKTELGNAYTSLKKNYDEAQTHIQNIQSELLNVSDTIEQYKKEAQQEREWRERAEQVQQNTQEQLEKRIEEWEKDNHTLREQINVLSNTLEEQNHQLELKNNHIQNIEQVVHEFDGVRSSLFYKVFVLQRSISNPFVKFFSHSVLGVKVLFREGPMEFLKQLGQYVRGKHPVGNSLKEIQETTAYEQFRAVHTPTKVEKDEQQWEARHFEYMPTISMVMPVYNIDPHYLNEAIESIRAQWYPYWELCIHDDASSNELTRQCLEKWKNTDQRIHISFGEKNQNISLATNEAIKMATGEFIGLMDHDDVVTPDALYWVVKTLQTKRDADLLYSDEDKLTMDGHFVEPHLKPQWNPDLLLSQNYISHLGVIRKSIGDELGWFRPGFEGAQDYDLYLRIAEKTKNIFHIPKILYHWRKIPGSTAAEYDEKNYADVAAKKSLEAYIKRNHILGTVEQGLFPSTFRVKREVKGEPLVSIIIPFKDQVNLLEDLVPDLLKRTTYSEFEILLVSNNSEDPKTFSFVEKLKQNDTRVRTLQHNVPFNFSEINNWAVTEARGEYLVFLNNDTKIITPEWLSAMLEQCQRPEVGAVGAQLRYADDTIQHGGVILGIGGVAGHGSKYLAADHPGYFCRHGAIHNVSACTAAALMVKTSVFKEVGGYNEQDLKVAFNDVDLCLKIRKAGYLITYTPFAQLYHFESKSRGAEDTPEKIARFQQEISYMQENWGEELLTDPYYHPHLSNTHEDYRLSVQ